MGTGPSAAAAIVIDVAALANELAAAQRSAVPVELLTERHPELNWATARAVARATDELHRVAGDTQIGWKLGWTSEAMRTALGIDRPNWGTLWQSQVSNGSLELGRFIHPKLEPELVWRAGADLAGSEITAEDVNAAGGKWALGIEVVDPRFPSFNFDALDNTADNSSSAAICLGPFTTVEPHTVLNTRTVTLHADSADGQEERTGPGSQAMGSPAEAVAWLVRSLSAEGLGLRAGEIVFTGGLTAPFDAAAGVTYSVAADDMAAVSLRFG